MIKVKIFDEHNYLVLEDAINDFLSDKNILLRDIKYVLDDRMGYYSVLIVYEENKHD